MNTNLIVQGLSLVLWIFAFAGLQINPDQVANDAYVAVKTVNWPLITIVVINFIGTAYKWYETWKTDKPNFWLFLRSHNWWASALNIGFSVAAMYGIVISADAAGKIVEYGFMGDWWGLAGYILPTVIAPIVTFITKKKSDAQKALIAKGKRV